MTPTILIADDDDTSVQLFSEVLAAEGYTVRRAQGGAEAIALLKEMAPDLLVVDVRMPGTGGLEVTRIAHRNYPAMPIVVMTAFGCMDTAIAAIQEGAFDFISKPVNLEQLKGIVARALAQRELGTGDGAKPRPEEAPQLGTVVGNSPAMVEVYKTIGRAAPTKSTVLILGESGTGKELIARALHEHSPQAGKPFVAVDCGALTETLLASELFGHVRGAFTGAVSDKKGVFEEADGGTCFLDEIGNINLETQAKLLRVLQEHEVKRVGSQKSVKVDVRIIAATNKDLKALLRSGAFREDLYYRIKVVTIRLPPLRERKDDIPRLAEYFLRRYRSDNQKPVNEISDNAMDLLQNYSWPGNIRELENVVERAVVLSNQPVLGPDDLPPEIRHASDWKASDTSGNETFHIGDTPTLDIIKKRYVLHVLALSRGNVTRAAKTLNIDRRSLYRMLDRYKEQPALDNGQH
ncbi:MAG TPA: sigma-54 dependent transcriptional regulator [Terriglobales bacterium]|jgi:DNA-binding NtrC family response regulator|nr:sigma-54 dependent transcriptional regulator [Terriglobales bacterium]